MLQYNVGHRHNLASWRKALSGMKWFRSNIRPGSRIALFALAVQFALSFGHFHGGAAQASPVEVNHFGFHDSADFAIARNAVPMGSHAPAAGSLRLRTSSRHDHPAHQPADECAICAVMAMASTVLFATPPLLLLPQAIELLYFTTDAEFAHLCSARVAFQPRAPPVFLTSID